MEATFFEAVQAGGNVAVMAIAVAIWRIDRRVFRLEIRAGILDGSRTNESGTV